MKKPSFVSNQPRFGVPHKREDPRIKRASLVTGVIRFVEEPRPYALTPRYGPPPGFSSYFEYVGDVEYFDVENGETYYDFE